MRSLSRRAPVVLAVSVVVGLALVPAAQASKGVFNAFGGSGTTGGKLGATTAPSVNSVSGEIYVADVSNHRIQRFDSSGNFISAWGKDVVKAGAPGDTGTGFELCTVASDCMEGVSGSLGGEFNSVRSIATDPTSGNVYVGDSSNRRIQVFSAAGAFIKAFGRDVVQSGQPGDNPAGSAKQTLTVTATGGKYTLEFEGQKTAVELSVTASAAEIQAALEALSSIGAGNVEVTGASPSFTIAFKGTHANNPEPDIVAASSAGDPLTGGGVSVATTTPGSNGFEVCTVAVSCQAGAAASSERTSAGAFNSVGAGIASLTIAPNAGNLLARDISNRRVQEFTPTGTFIRAFGWDVTAAGPGNTGTGFEVCRASTFDACKAGTDGSGLGQFGGSSSPDDQITEDSAGNIYTVESAANFRVQRFAQAGTSITPEAFNPSIGGGEFLTGTSPSRSSGGNSPAGVAIGAGGNVLVIRGVAAGTGSPPAAKFEQRVLEFSPGGMLLDTHIAGAGLTLATSLAFKSPAGPLYLLANPSGFATFAYVIDDVPPITLTPEASETGAVTATFHATVTPSQIPLHTLYHFEYAPAGSGEWKSTPETDIGNGASPVAVSAEAEGLDFDATYELKVIAHTSYNGTQAVAEAEPFTTHAIAPLVSTGRARWSSPPSTGPSLTLTGTINPGHDQTSYNFQYVSEEGFQASGFASAKSVPLLPAPAGHGIVNTDVMQPVTGLDPAKAYRYRLVATNSTGTATGSVRSVSPPDPSARFYELLSAEDLNGLGGRAIIAVSDNGERAALLSQTLADPHSLPGQYSPFLATRTASGWSISQLTPDPADVHGGNLFGSIQWFPADLSTALWSHTDLAGQIRGEIDWTFTDPDGIFRAALPAMVPIQGHGTGLSGTITFNLRGGAADLSSFVFQRDAAAEEKEKEELAATFLPGQPLVNTDAGPVYRVSGAGGPSPSLSLLNVDPAGNLISNACGAWVGSIKSNTTPGADAASRGVSLRPVSSDGSVAYFSARPGVGATCNAAAESANRIRIFKRIGDTETVAVSQSQCTRTVPTTCSSSNGDDFFQGASASGSRVFFTTTRQLANTDEDGTNDLYLYDSSPPAGQPTLVQASAGEVTAGHAKVGSGAEVLGGQQTAGVLDISIDGSRAYFVAKGQLTPQATKGVSNLYVYERDDAHPTGRVAFIAKLDAGDSSLWSTGATSKPTYAMPFEGPGGGGEGDGHFLLFSSLAKLAPEDTDTSTDLYRYDDGTATTTCLTCAGNGSFNVEVKNHGGFANPASIQENRIASEDLSTVAFATKESLVATDENSVSDAYEWHEGSIRLVSTGDPSSTGLDLAKGGKPIVSADGKSIFFTTEDRILPADHNSTVDVYSARTGGGFPDAGLEQTCASPEECRTAPVGTPSAPSAATPSFSGAGNVTPPAKCRKGKVRRHGRCVSQKKHKQKKRQAKKQKRNASDNRGGKR